MRKLLYLTVFLFTGTGVAYGQHISTTNSQTNGNIYHLGGNLGIGTITPSGKLHIMSSNFKDFIVLDRTSRPEIDNVFHITPSWDSDQNDQLRIMADDINLISFEETGRVGIGTINPDEKLHVNGTGYFHSNIGGIKIDGTTTEAANGYIRSSLLSSRDGDLEWDEDNDLWTLGPGNYNDFAGIIHRNNGKLSFYTGNSNAFSSLSNDDFQNQFERLTILGNGNVGIGTASPDEKLTVKGTIHTEEVRVDLNVPAPDYVFEPDYNLRSLKDTETYINKNKHLPEIPSAKEMEAHGVELGDMNMLLLKKIEELTLYTIEQQKEIQTLKKENETLKSFSKRLSALENQLKSKN